MDCWQTIVVEDIPTFFPIVNFAPLATMILLGRFSPVSVYLQYDLI